MRWTLIGDYLQLGPHRAHDVEAFLEGLDSNQHERVRLHYEQRESYLEFVQLFRRFFTGHTPGVAADARLPVDVLNMQFRMHRDISLPFARAFYPAITADDPDGTFLKTDPQLRRVHQHTKPYYLKGAPLVWLDTSRCDDCGDLGYWWNPGEVKLVEHLVRTMGLADRRDPKELAVLTPYRRQVQELEDGFLKGRVHTVHSFQGGEAKTVVVSLVRSTEQGTDSRQSVGHTAQPDVVNVMLSRARSLLVVVGNMAHFERHGGTDWQKVIEVFRAVGRIVDASTGEIVSGGPRRRSSPHNSRGSPHRRPPWRRSPRRRPRGRTTAWVRPATRLTRSRRATTGRGPVTETTLIAVPCRVITLRVELGADSGASSLEALVLEAVAGGRPTVRELGELFSLPHRLILDVVHGLWSRGFLAVDFATHSLESTQAAEAVLGGQEGHAALTLSVQQRKFLFDPVTATVLPFKHSRERVPQGALEMPLAQGISEDDLPQTELLRAVRQAVDHDRSDDGRSRVLNVSFANPVLSPPQAVRWRTVETVVKRDPGTGLLTAVPVTPPPGWGRRAQELFQSRVTELAHNRPDSRFAKLLEGRQVLEEGRSESLRVVMQRLDRLAAELTSAPDDRVPSMHDDLSLAALQVLEDLDEARQGRCSAGQRGRRGGRGLGGVPPDRGRHPPGGACAAGYFVRLPAPGAALARTRRETRGHPGVPVGQHPVLEAGVTGGHRPVRPPVALS